MSYSFDIVGVAPVLEFFTHQQRMETKPQRSQAFLGSSICTLDAFISATEAVHRKPDWDWDEIVGKIVEFWLHQEDDVRHWKQRFESAQGQDNLLVGRVVNYTSLRQEFEGLFEG